MRTLTILGSTGSIGTQTLDIVRQFKDDFWNTALFLGVGYRSENITIGMRYNVLFKETDGIYADPYMPFVRLYF